MSQEHVEVVRRAYESFNRWAARPESEPFADPEVEDLLHPEVEFHTYANSPEAGVYRGRDAVVAYNQRLFEQFESVQVEVEELLSAADRVVVVSRQHAVPRTGEAEMVVQVVEVWTIRDGLLAKRQSFSTRTEALQAAGLSEQTMSQNVEIIRQGWDAWLRGDLPGVLQIMDPEVVWDTSHFRDWPESAYHGREGVERFLNEWLEVWDDYRLELEDVIEAPDGRVVSLFRHRGRGRDSGAPMDLRMAQVATLRDRKVTRFDNFDAPAEALEAAGLRDG